MGAALLLGAAESSAQSAGAVLSGIVRNDSTGAPIPGVEVLLNGTPHRTETNAQGRYLLTGLPAGTYQAIYRLVGHLPARIDVRLVEGDTTRANTTLIPSAVVLNPVIVTGTPETKRGVGIGREAFEERRRLGFGRFIGTEALRRYETHLNLEDVLRRHGGIAIFRIRWRGILMRVAFNETRRTANGSYNCVMQVYYNGSPVGRGGIAGTSDVQPVDMWDYSVAGLDAVEIYRSAAEVPLEYGGANAGCGVILLWSRVAP